MLPLPQGGAGAGASALRVPAGAGWLTALNKGLPGLGSPRTQTPQGAFQPPKRCLLTQPPRQDKQGKKLVVDAAGCFVTCPVVSLELVWPWQLVPLTFRENNLKQAPAGPLLTFLTLYKLPKKNPPSCI